MSKIDAQALYKKIKTGESIFKEEIHCPMLLEVMADPDKGSYSAFCVKAEIGERTFYNWLARHEIFLTCYALGKMFSKENWEREGRIIAEEVTMPGMGNHRFEHWRMIGWNRFGIGKNSRIRLALNPSDTPDKHYTQLLTQASDGDFTAGEIKQLMEAINVGLNSHQVIALQKELDQLRLDLATMSTNSNVQNSNANTRIAQKD